MAPAPPARGAGRPPARSGAGAGRPPRPGGPPGPSYRRRRLLALALALTVVAALAYGGTWVAGHVFGGGSSGGSAASGDVTGAIDRSIGAGFGAIGSGLGMRNLHDQYQTRDDINRAIDVVRQERATLDAAVGTVTGARADALGTAIFAEGGLEEALGQWRDVVFNLRFGQVDAAKTAVTDAITALAKARDAWNAAGSSS